MAKIVNVQHPVALYRINSSHNDARTWELLLGMRTPHVLSFFHFFFKFSYIADYPLNSTFTIDSSKSYNCVISKICACCFGTLRGTIARYWSVVQQIIKFAIFITPSLVEQCAVMINYPDFLTKYIKHKIETNDKWSRIYRCMESSWAK